MKWLKVAMVVFGAVLITALGIDAADTLNGSRSTLLGQLVAVDSVSGPCPADMVEVPMATTFTCVDRYEASPSVDCPHANPNSARQTQMNLNDSSCVSTAAEAVVPWRFITRDQAAVTCLRSGKRLMSAAEWYVIAGGTPDTDQCNIASAAAREAGDSQQCVSAVGAYDTIGNVWEWTSDDVIDGQYAGRAVPVAGYVAQVDAQGFPTVTDTTPAELFSADYFWSASDGAFGVMRGGYYGSQSDAGVYATHAETPPTASGCCDRFSLRTIAGSFYTVIPHFETVISYNNE